MTLLSLQQITAGYPRGFSIRDISFDVRRGSLVGIIGPNGSGKSTLLSTLMGDLGLQSGRLVMNGIDLASISRRDRARLISVVPQMIDPIAIPLEDYVEMGRLPHQGALQLFASDEDKRITRHYLDLVGMRGMAGRYMTELSGGEQQMGAIAQALSVEPQLLLLDEATAHLDITHAANVLDIVHRLSRDPDRRLTVIAVLHDLTLASEYCDHLILMKEGTLYAHGTPEEVLTRENIRGVYHADVTITPHPVSGRPMVLPSLLDGQ